MFGRSTTQHITNAQSIVTGTSTGVGRALAEVALEHGDRVVATARSPSSVDDLGQKYPGTDRLLVVSLDVTQPHQVADAFARAMETFGRVDVVVNNAGSAGMGELEGYDETQARNIMETNFWGVINVTREAIKCFRECNPPGEGGRLLQMSSIFGLRGSPLGSFYAASKFGM